MTRTAIVVGPEDHGRRMSLADFDKAEVREGYLCELGRGVIVVSDVPGRRHLVQIHAIRRQISAYDLSNPGKIAIIATGNECKILVPLFESERHPDLAVYKSPPPDDVDLWTIWVPELAIEVVSPGSEHRDYVEKREEYLHFGVKEYWIFDVAQRSLLTLRRSGDQWVERVVRPPRPHKTRLFPGLEFDCAAVFAAADAVS